MWLNRIVMRMSLWRASLWALTNEAPFHSNSVMWVMDRWRLDYNHRQGHRARDDQTLAAFVANCVQWLKNI